MGLSGEFWRRRRVLLTGHTGFKGSWLALWLQAVGAEVYGFSRDVPTSPSLYELAKVRDAMASEISADVRDFEAVAAAVKRHAPEIVIHMAAQSLVRRSFEHPRETYETNVLGTVNVLDALRHQPGVRVALVVTSDKCYENREWEWGYREDDPMGGYDPYSSSKGAAELVTTAYRRSFFDGQEGLRVASARAGNVIGGGDWGPDRLVPDAARAVAEGVGLRVRNPDAVRPWQHVLNPLTGYLVLAETLWDAPEFAGPWNFGPGDDDARSVRWLLEQLGTRWPALEWETDRTPQPHEAHYLKLDSSRARVRLGWRPPVSLSRALDSVVAWYDAFVRGGDMREVTLAQIDELVTPRGA